MGEHAELCVISPRHDGHGPAPSAAQAPRVVFALVGAGEWKQKVSIGVGSSSRSNEKPRDYPRLDETEDSTKRKARQPLEVCNYQPTVPPSASTRKKIRCERELDSSILDPAILDL